MLTVEEIRLKRLEMLVIEAGSAEALAKRCETAPEYISQLRKRAIDKKTGRPRMPGAQLARKLEAGMKKPAGWMDMPLPDDRPPDQVELLLDSPPGLTPAALAPRRRSASNPKGRSRCSSTGDPALGVAHTIADSQQPAGPPALSRPSVVITLTIKLQISYQQVAQLIVLLIVLLS